MSRSLLPAFLMALILHSLLAFVELEAFKRPVSVNVLPKTLTIDIDIAKPRSVKKPPFIKSLAVVNREPILEKKIPKRIKPKAMVEPQALPPAEPARLLSENVVGRQDKEPRDLKGQEEKPAHLSKVDLAAIEKEDIFLQEDNFFVPGTPSPPPVTYALPVYKKNIPPQYPLLARRRGYQGKVLLKVLVKKDGKAGSIRLSKSSGYEMLDRAAIRGVKNWLFYPGKRGDELVDMWVEIPIRFQLN